MRSFVILAVIALSLGRSVAAPPLAASDKPSFAYVGTYAGGGGQGIYLFAFVPGESPALEPRGVAAELQNSSFLAVDAARQRLFAVSEMGDGEAPHGGVSAFGFDPATGKLTVINQQSSRGSGPCHLALSPEGRHVVVANYNSGNVSVLPIDEHGALGEATDVKQHAGSGPNSQRQEGPHAHCVTFSPEGGRVYVCDLGIDKVMIYKFDAAAGKLAPNDPPFAELKPGAGPRHMAFGADGRFAYVINELDGTLTTFAYDAATGALKTVGSASTLPEGFSEPNTNAEVAVHPSGKFLYTSNRGSDTIGVFQINETTGLPSLLEHVPTGGSTPRHFAIDPAGEVLVAENQGSGTMKMFSIDASTGRLTATGEIIETPTPVCLVFVPGEGEIRAIL